MKNDNFKLKNIKKDFPIFERTIINNKPLIYLDSTATALKPRSMINAVNSYYQEYSANVFRGIYKISEKATSEYEKAREKVASLINAKDAKEIIFVRNTTEAINLVAYSWGRLNIERGDEIVTTIMEHHSNFVPWQQLCLENDATLKVLDIDNNYELRITTPNQKQSFGSGQDYELRKIISQKTKLLAITHVSNVLGTINPIKKIVAEVKKINSECLVLVDGAQAVPHMKVDVRDLGCDFYVFSGHKMMGPTGIGVLWGKEELLKQMAPFNFGGDMIGEVRLQKTTFKEIPHKFEAGTPHIAGAIGLGAAVDYLQKIGMDKIRQHEIELTNYGLKYLSNLNCLSIYGPKKAEEKGGVIAFNLFTKGGKLIHPHDVAQILDEENICIRAGHHCAMPLHQRLGIPASARASFYIYNSKEDVDMLIKGLKQVVKIL